MTDEGIILLRSELIAVSKSAGVDPRTLRRCLLGDRVRYGTQERICAALREAGRDDAADCIERRLAGAVVVAPSIRGDHANDYEP